MALLALRLRRTLTALPSLSRSLSSPKPFAVPSCYLLPNPTATNFASSSPDTFHCRSFRSSVLLSSSTRQFKLYREGDEIDENTILFEGCDYNHWLIVVDFPRDQPKPPAEEMIRTYERICTEGLGVSIEEAKKRIYACSTTTYEGFQVEMTEEESQKFESLPGVVFVLPDSYIDPVNKQYGGDKYENGVITPRPLPPQYANNNRRRPRDRDDRGRYDPQGRQTQSWQGNPPYNHQGPVQGDGRDLGPQQGHPAQSYVPQPMNNRSYDPQPSVNSRSYAPQPAMNNRSYEQQQPVNSQSYAQQPPMSSQNYAPPSPVNNQNYGMQPPMNSQNYGPGRSDPYKGAGSGTSPPVNRGNFSQDGQRNYYPQEQREEQQTGQGNVAPTGLGYEQVASPRFGEGTNTSYGQGNWKEANPAYRQGLNPGSGQSTGPGYNRQVPGQGTNPGFGQGVGPSYGQNYSQGGNPVYGQGANHQEQRDEQQTGQGNVAPTGPGYEQVASPRFGEGTNTSYGQGNWKEANPGYGQGANPGSGQGTGPGYNSQVHGQGANPGFGQGVGQSYGQSYSQGANPGYAQGVHGDGQRIPQSEQSAPLGPAGIVQGRF